MSPSKYPKSITRIDTERSRTHGWNVRIHFEGSTKRKLFSDKKHGGTETALEAAIKWRNATEKKLGKTRTERVVFTSPQTDTGVVGVSFYEKEDKYVVTWVSPDGSQSKTSIGIQRIGKGAAFVMACSLRLEKDKLRLLG